MGRQIWTSLPGAPVLLVCPTRDRPGNAARLIRTWGHTGACSDLLFCLDDDDPQMGGYRELMTRRAFHRGTVTWLTGPRRGLCAWTNWVAREYGPAYEALMSIGDDHVPETEGFDLQLLDAAAGMGGGFASPDDGRPSGVLPTCWLVTANVVEALRWVCLPGLEHMFPDAVVKHLGEASGQWVHLPDVMVRHHHWSVGLAPPDATYARGQAAWAADEAVFRAWLAEDRPAAERPVNRDAETVRGACHAAV